jgi:ABC-type dipeptide/oligopeptide/nickel transport system permease component
MLLLAGLVLLLVVATRRGASGARIAVLVITGIVSIPAALLGILLMGFSGSAEDTQNGASLWPSA